MKKIGLVVKPDANAIKKADELENWLQKKKIQVIRKEYFIPNKKHPNKNIISAPEDLFCVFVLGGDGTFLSAARWIGDKQIPILGVKFGEVGFLAETAAEALIPVAEAVLNNKYKIKPRTRLKVNVRRGDKEIVCETVLNDVVINKGALARLAHIETYINNNYLTTFRGDGLVISTPTGSTAYSLAAGGPIIHPAVPSIILTPICPFTLTNRPLIVPETIIIKIRLAKNSSDIMLTFDGQEGLEIDDRDTITITKGDHPLRMIRMPDQKYFDILKTKLRWGGSSI